MSYAEPMLAVRVAFCLIALLLTPPISSAADRDFLPYEKVKAFVPVDLRVSNEAQWSAWRKRQDEGIRARLEQGDLDSVVNLLLFGTSFTRQPRIRMDRITEASKAGILRARLDDMVAGLRHPADNERLAFVEQLLNRQGVDPQEPAKSGVFLFNNLMRVVQERISLGERVAVAQALRREDSPDSLLDREAVFRDRGVSLDATILPNFLVERTLRDLKNRGLLREGQVSRVAVVGPGLDFIDKNEDFAYDYYPPQTLQPFALYDSLLRLKLAKGGALSLSILDISPRVIQHLDGAVVRAVKNQGYVIQLPRNRGRGWNADITAYWQSLGDQVGNAVEPIRAPAALPELESRAVRIRPEVVRKLTATDLNIVMEHLKLPAQAKYDVIVGTNIFIYYDEFQQRLALENAAEMLKPGGFLITNDKLPETPGGAMRFQGITVIPDPITGAGSSLAVGWYLKTGAGK